MYAVIESGNKQYRVELGTEIQVDRLDVQAGDSITLDRVLLVADGEEAAIGQPVVAGATVSADVLRQERGDKIVIFKYKPKARTRVKKGFRAELTTLRISEIAFGGRSAAKDAQQSEAQQDKAAKDAEQAAAAKASADSELAAKLATANEAAAPVSTLAAKPKAAKPKAAKPKAAKPKATSPRESAVEASSAETPPDDSVVEKESPDQADPAVAPDEARKDE